MRRDLAGDHHVAVLAAEPDRLAAGRVDEADDLLVDRAGQHHLDDLDGRRVGDAQPGRRIRDLMPSRLSMSPICGPPPCTTTGLMAVCSISTMSRAKLRASVLFAHGVAAVFHHDDLLVVALHVRERLRQDARRCRGAKRSSWRSFERSAERRGSKVAAPFSACSGKVGIGFPHAASANRVLDAGYA